MTTPEIVEDQPQLRRVMGPGLLLLFVTMLINRQLGIRGTGITDPTHLGSAPD